MSSYEFVCDASDPGWLDHRATMITGSEMSLVLGTAPKWFKKSRDELIAEKRAGKSDSFQPTRRMLWGSWCEKRNLADACHFLGVQGRSTNALLRSTICPRIGSTLDGLVRIPSSARPFEFADYCGNQKHAQEVWEQIVERRGQFGLLEMKQTDFLGEWKDYVPYYSLTQVQTQLYVTRRSWAMVAAKIGASDMRVYFVEPDEFLFEEMESEVEDFWKEVESE